MKELSSATSFPSTTLLALVMGTSLSAMTFVTTTTLALAAAAAAFAACLFCFLFSLAVVSGSGLVAFPGPATTSGFSAVSSVLVDSFASSSSRPVEAS
jgi:hypothetical protein